ncbi:NAD(P)-binding protein [Cucurbitaria berberidis CBS 394.84]|uniref:NAD(P)-binding protein n=1 Tax=Cucurbitaria berberidis CBS 394.84 TaxID=1168544 RepID=A0A9P4LA83_9PLEO|nr:NAD(P)-binding protein [Cucurbitaria berberidis CBS 394.84]KAF1848121.1 NAD(P)-binding protein [Cucurbitaria berberidis CBS 394.84]
MATSRANNHVKKIAIVGAGGNVGSHLVTALLGKHRFDITAISRAESKASFPEGIAIAHVDYNKPETIIEALRGQDVLIITLSVFAAGDTQATLIRAAADAGVPWVLPNEFGGEDGEAQNDTMGPAKVKDRGLIEELGVSSWIGVASSFWYEHSLSGPGLYGFDVTKREVVFFDEGTERLDTSTWPQVGRAVASLLSLPISPQETNGNGPTLTGYRNRMIHISSFTLNQHEMFASLKRVTNTVDSDWSITSVSTKHRFAEALEKLKGGDRSAFGTVLYTRYFFPGEGAGLFEKRHDLDNEKLGLPHEDLDEATKAALKLSESGYWKNYGKR